MIAEAEESVAFSPVATLVIVALALAMWLWLFWPRKWRQPTNNEEIAARMRKALERMEREGRLAADDEEEATR